MLYKNAFDDDLNFEDLKILKDYIAKSSTAYAKKNPVPAFAAPFLAGYALRYRPVRKAASKGVKFIIKKLLKNLKEDYV